MLSKHTVNKSNLRVCQTITIGYDYRSIAYCTFQLPTRRGRHTSIRIASILLTVGVGNMSRRRTTDGISAKTYDSDIMMAGEGITGTSGVEGERRGTEGMKRFRPEAAIERRGMAIVG